MKSDMKNPLGWLQFITRRIAKTYLPAVLVSALWLSFAAITSLDLLCNQDYLLGVVWWFNDEVLWFVNSIMIMYIAFRLYRSFSFSPTKIQAIALASIGVITYSFLRIFGIGSTLSVPLFFIGVLVAQFGQQVRTFFQSMYVEIALMLIAVILLWFFRHDNYLLHGWINYFTIGLSLCIVSKWNISLSIIPKWLGSCSYDVYLVHHKVHLAILYFYGIDRMWLFTVVTVIATVLFYSLRRLLKI